MLHVSLELGGAQHTYSRYDYAVLKYGGQARALKKLMYHTDVRRGDLTISLSSPSGVISHMLPHRPRDFVNSVGFRRWPFMSVIHWAEQPRGMWMVNISYTPGPHTHRQGYAIVSGLELSLYGTVVLPKSVLSIPRQCHHQCASTCGGEGPFMCDSCKSLRNSYTLECIDKCSDEDERHGRYCVPPSNSTGCLYHYLPSSSTPIMEHTPSLPHPSHPHNISYSHKTSAVTAPYSPSVPVVVVTFIVTFVIL